MATRKPIAEPRNRNNGPPVDARGNVRIYTDVPKAIAQEFAILAVRRETTKRALMAKLIMDEVTGRKS